MKNYIPKRFLLLKTFSITFLLFAFIVRLSLYFLSFPHIDFSPINLLKVFGIGFLFDIGSLSYIISLYAVYLLSIPAKFHGSKLDKIVTKFAYSFFLFISIFSFLAEIPFWNEYQRRYNFIAVDYLLYTYEVIENIHQSFPLPLLIGIILLITYLSIKIAKNKDVYKNTFHNRNNLISKLIPSTICLSILGIFHFTIKNEQAEIFLNINENELAKSGLYSFFAAYKSNELNYDEFYTTIPEKEMFSTIRNIVKASNDSLINDTKSIKRFVTNTGIEQKPNVIFIGLESLNARFMKRFGNNQNITPAIDSLSSKSILFTNLYATGTRTIRGMEAIFLSIPPTPGRSIVKRANNDNLFTIGEIFRQKGYTRTFFYGGDGHFDNMNIFFGNNGFDIVDRKKKHRLQKDFPTKRTHISDEETTFENAWATCDGDLYNKLLKVADEQHKLPKPFFNFVMTSSNHQPYTYPDGIIDIPSGTSREGAVKYTDKSFEKFFKKAKTKPWFKNTVFVIMADHCAYSAGRTEIKVKNHHIPAFIYNLKNQEAKEVDKLCSQIDIFPTLFGYLNWNYNTNIFGKDITKMHPKDERAFIANHRKLGLLKKDKLLVLNNHKNHAFYNWNNTDNSLTPIQKTDTLLLNEAVSYYQTAFYLFKNGGLKIKLKTGN